MEFQALESPEQTQQRKDRVSAAILDYRRKQGLFVDPEEEAKWNAVLSMGIQLLQNGHLKDATEQFEEVLRAVPPRSSLGGEAQLQRAICLDSAVSRLHSFLPSPLQIPAKLARPAFAAIVKGLLLQNEKERLFRQDLSSAENQIVPSRSVY